MIDKKKIAFYTFCVTYMICMIIYIGWTKNIFAFNVNLFSQTKFETKNFIIDLPRFYWIGKYVEKDIFFMGIGTNNKDVEYNTLLIGLTPFIDAKVEGLGMLCNEQVEKTVEKLDNKDVTVYGCTQSNLKNGISFIHKYIVYKDEALAMYYYVDDLEALQPLYDKFFEGVKLK